MAYLFDELKNMKDFLEVVDSEYAKVDSPTFTGVPTVPNQSGTRNDNRVANLLFVKNVYDLFYPVGSIYETIDYFYPDYGTWEEIGSAAHSDGYWHTYYRRTL